MTNKRLCLIVAFVFFVIAGLAALGVAHLPTEALALFGLAFWAVSGAVAAP